MYTSFYWYDTGNAHVFLQLNTEIWRFSFRDWVTDGCVVAWGTSPNLQTPQSAKTPPVGRFVQIQQSRCWQNYPLCFLCSSRPEFIISRPRKARRLTPRFPSTNNLSVLHKNTSAPAEYKWAVEKKVSPGLRLLVSVDWWRIYNSGYRRTVRLNVQNLCKAWDDCRGWRWVETVEQSSAAGHCSFSPKYLVLELYLVTRMWMLSLSSF